MVGCMGSWRSSGSLLLLRLSSHGRSSSSSSSISSNNNNSVRELKASTSDGQCKWDPQSGSAYRSSSCSSSSSLTGRISPLPLHLPPLLQAPPSVSGFCSVNKENRA
jgi:hypothetical protein